MTRQTYIHHLDDLYAAVQQVMQVRAKAIQTHGVFKPGGIEEDRAKKTDKMIEDLAIRIFEDGAVSRRIREENIANGRLEQEELDFSGVK